MPRRKPSGSKATRFVMLEGREIPVSKDEATELELKDGELLAMLTGDGGWAREGVTFWAQKDGTEHPFWIGRLELHVDMHPGFGDYGQVKRKAQIKPVEAERVFTWPGQKIPLSNDECTEHYLERAGGEIVKKPMIRLLGDGSWAEPGAYIVGNRLGEKSAYLVVLVELEVDIHEDRGRWGQLRRRTLAKSVEMMEDVGDE